MKVQAVAARRPDIHLTFTWDEADKLLDMVQEGKAYASDCGDSTESHETFINQVQEVLDQTAS